MDYNWSYLRKVEFARKLLKERSLDYFQGSLVLFTQPRASRWNFKRNLEVSHQVDVAVDRFLQNSLEDVLLYPPSTTKTPQPVSHLNELTELYRRPKHILRHKKTEHRPRSFGTRLVLEPLTPVRNKRASSRLLMH